MHISILRRMTGQRIEEVAQSPLTSSRAVKMALTKAAQDTVGLNLSVKLVEETVQSLDQMLAGLADDLMLVELQRQGRSVGLIAFDMQMRAAVLEKQTVGQLAKQPAQERAATGTDKRMCDPLLTGFLQALPQAVVGTEFEGWLSAVSHHKMIAGSRAAGLVLDDRDYRVLRLIVDLGVADREGVVLLALPLSSNEEQPAEHVIDLVDWDTAFHDAVSGASAVFDAVLHRFTIPLSQAEMLHVGQVLPLTGCTVSSVQLIALDGRVVRQARLGQLGGKRAVRIQQAAPPQMDDLAARRAMRLPDVITDVPMVASSVEPENAIPSAKPALTAPRDSND